MNARHILWITTGAGAQGEMHERLKGAIKALDCRVTEVNARDVEHLLDVLEAGAVPVVVKEATVD